MLRVLAAGLGLVLGTGTAVWLVLWISLRSSAVHVPAVVGLDSARAAAVLGDAGLLVRTQDGVFNPAIPAGRVAMQRPAPGFELKRGGFVLIYPSLGEAAKRLPELAGLPVPVAQAQIEEEGLAAGARCEVEGQADAVVVLAQTPPPGTLVAPGSEVALLINRVPRDRRFVMPDFVGASEADATRVARALGFRLANVQRVPYPGIRAGVVLRQDPAAGGPVSEAAITALWVSR